MKKLSIIIMVLMAFFYAGCASDDYGYSEEPTSADTGADYDTDTYSDEENDYDITDNDLNRKIIYTARLEFLNETPADIYDEILIVIGNYSAYIEDEYISNDINITVRVLSTELDDFLDEVKAGSGNLISSSIESEDITQSYSTFDSRRIALEAEHARVLELIEEADSISVLLELEKFRGDIEAELNYINSQLSSYDSLVNYSTVRIYIEEKYTSDKFKLPYGERIVDRFLSSVDGVVNFFEEAFLFLIGAIPVLAVLGVLGGAGLYIRKRFFKNKRQSVREKVKKDPK